MAPDNLWAEFVDLNNGPSIQANFGYLVDLTEQAISSRNKIDYLATVRGLFFSFFTGPTINAMRTGLQLLNGLPVAEEAGEIISITDPVEARIGRIRVRDAKNPAIVRVYFYPRRLGLAEIKDPVTGEPGVVEENPHLFLFTGSYLKSYVQGVCTYIERAMYRPNSLGCVRIRIKPYHRELYPERFVV